MRAWLPPVLYALLILVGSSVPSSAVPDVAIFRADKLLHLAQYAIFGGLLYRGLYLGTRWPELACVALAMGATAVFGGLDELYQRLTPGRHSSIWDVAADGTGGVLGVALTWTWFWRKKSGDDSKLRRQGAEHRRGDVFVRDGGARR